MNIQHFSQQGKRSNNEDIGAALLIMCDDMRGHVLENKPRFSMVKLIEKL